MPGWNTPNHLRYMEDGDGRREPLAHNQRLDMLMRLERIEQWLAQIASLLQQGAVR